MQGVERFFFLVDYVAPGNCDTEQAKPILRWGGAIIEVEASCHMLMITLISRRTRGQDAGWSLKTQIIVDKISEE